MRYDSIIVGAGPAGLEAALNLKIRNKKFLLFGVPAISEKVKKAPEIQNYLGLGKINGKDMANRFAEHLSEMDIEIVPEKVAAIYSMGDYFSISTNEGLYESDTVILATGVFAATPYKGEEEFLGRGVGYCATCDAPLYRGKKVVIVGATDEAQHEANFVSEIAAEVIYVPVKSKTDLLNESVKVVSGKVVAIEGDKKAEKLLLDTQEILADGFFILRDNIAPSSLIPGIELDEKHIKVDANMATNIPGCYAAGDCVGSPYQYIKAAGQGLTASFSVVKYLAEQKQLKVRT